MNWEQHYRQREEMDEFSGYIPYQPKTTKNNSNQQQHKENTTNKKKPKEQNKNNKITSFVISALQYVIDSLR
jgi:hypothetical protein